MESEKRQLNWNLEIFAEFKPLSTSIPPQFYPWSDEILILENLRNERVFGILYLSFETVSLTGGGLLSECLFSL